MEKIVVLVLFLCVSALAGQTGQVAHGTYARNGILIGLTELAPLRDCRVEAMEGKARSIEIGKTDVAFDLKSDERRLSFRFPITRLGPQERRSLRRNFLQKGLPLRATAYACTDDSTQPLETITLARVY